MKITRYNRYLSSPYTACFPNPLFQLESAAHNTSLVRRSRGYAFRSFTRYGRDTFRRSTKLPSNKTDGRVIVKNRVRAVSFAYHCDTLVGSSSLRSRYVCDDRQGEKNYLVKKCILQTFRFRVVIGRDKMKTKKINVRRIV